MLIKIKPLVVVLLAGWFCASACSDDPDSNPTGDGTATQKDSGTTQKDGGSNCAAALNPTDDGTGIPDLIISEVKPGAGGFIEFFNTTASDIDTTTTSEQLCAGKEYVQLKAAGSTTIPAGGFGTIDWPSFWSKSDGTNGDLAIFKNTGFGDGSNINDYVCWGTPTVGRKTEAEQGAKWSGDCVASPTESVKRKPGTKGLTSSDYDGTATASKDNCAP